MPTRPAPFKRLTTAIVCGSLILASTSPQARLPQKDTEPLEVPALMPAFQPPSARDCKRPVQTREVPGRTAAELAQRERDMREDLEALEKPGRLAKRERRASEEPLVLGKAAVPALAESIEADSVGAVSDAAKPASEAASEPAAPSPMPSPAKAKGASGAIAQPAPRSVVTAGMVDDNADFSEFLAFRTRTQVPHEERDVSERYLLEVKDERGRSVPDAVVEVTSAQGATLWARSDAAGKVWLHPNAFDPGGAGVYEVAVHRGKASGTGYLRRGQKSAVEVTLSHVPALQRARLDLVFLVDATGSMGDEIDKLKASIQAIANDAAHLPSQPDLCFGLVAYRDKGDAFLMRSHDLTNDLAGFQKVLNALRADGGGDMPEAMSEALHETVHGLSWRGDGATRMVVLLADAPPQLGPDRPRYDDAMLAALGKGIKIFSVGASGLDPQGEYIHRQLAQFTGGRFVFLTYDKADQPASGPGRETVHDVKNYSVSTLDKLIVRLIREELAKLPIKTSKDA